EVSGVKKRYIVILLLGASILPGSRANVFSQGSNAANKNDISELVTKLYNTKTNGIIYGPDLLIQQSVQNELLMMALRSTEVRNQVIHALISMLEASEKEGQDSQIGFPAWQCAAKVLGKLRATEAIDILVRNLDYQAPLVTMSSSLNMAEAVTNIGDPAIPKLTEALKTGRRSVRAYAATALGGIGGEQARQTLERAVATETDGLVVAWIKRTLFVMSERSLDK
ncbi:MAG TPA: HEAT repeat domain-containing protein, partial [Blastocatellia bacterium]|nr:HEAT repeat domain-containing protein [Blastocatellia bacterium]